jgi:hypothetical protein
MMAPEPQRWARSPPHLAWKRPSLPTHWVRVLERHSDGIAAEPGYVWLDMPGKGDAAAHPARERSECTASGSRDIAER